MLSNPPYGKSWKTDLENMGGKDGITDPRFIVNHAGDPEYSLLTRSSDGQMLFLANMVSKMKNDTPLGSRIAEIHSGSSMFTGDAGQGESNIRRWIIEQDLLEAIIQMPENMFYNTGIATHIWVLSNRKAEHRKGKVQLIDATPWSTPLRKNLGAKNCELSPDNIELIIKTFLDFKDGPQSKIFPNEAFGYRKVKVERPLRLRSQCSTELIDKLRFASGDEALRHELHDMFGDDVFEKFASIKPKLEKHLDGDESEDEDGGVPAGTRKRLLDEKKWQRDNKLYNIGLKLADALGGDIFDDHNEFAAKVDAMLSKWGEKLSAGDRKTLLRGLSWADAEAPQVIKKVSKSDKAAADPMHGFFQALIDGKKMTVEYEADSDLSDFENVPLNEEGGVESFITREVLPYSPDAWVDPKSEKIGYELSFTRHFYKPVELRPLTEIEADIRKLMDESDGLLHQALQSGSNER
jgi:type I restriction enzyme M protein